MANYFAIADRFPAARIYLKHRRWVRRGDVTAYAPDQRTPCFSTDAMGFRHTRWRGAQYGIGAADNGSPYGVVLGSSHIFGFGLEDDSGTLPSQLSDLVGFPCLNISYPEADSRSLHATLLRIVQGAPRRPALIVFFNGGDLTRYCYTGLADPLFGSPAPEGAKTQPSALDSDDAFRRLAFFSRFWAIQSARLAKRSDVPFCFAMDSTFFEKSVPTDTEAACELGVAKSPSQTRRFAIHRQRVMEFSRLRIEFAGELNLPPPWFYGFDDVAFIDEFHFQPQSLRLIAERIAEQFQAEGAG
jgi:hypothetical protein